MPKMWKYINENHVINKGQHLVKTMVKLYTKLAGMLKDKRSNSMCNYNNQLSDKCLPMHTLTGVKYIKKTNVGDE